MRSHSINVHIEGRDWMTLFSEIPDLQQNELKGKSSSSLCCVRLVPLPFWQSKVTGLSSLKRTRENEMFDNVGYSFTPRWLLFHCNSFRRPFSTFPFRFHLVHSTYVYYLCDFLFLFSQEKNQRQAATATSTVGF